MESEFLLQVSALQACVRGVLVRRQFHSLRTEYESIVQEIEGDLGTLQWSAGPIPRPQFLPKKAGCHRWKAGEKLPRPERKLRSHWEEMAPEKPGEASADPGSLCRDDTLGRQAEHNNKTGNPSQEETGDTSGMENTEATSAGPCHSQQELQQLQHHRSHLAMELLWLQQAINSRKEYLVLRQTLTSPEAARTRDELRLCPDHGAQACKKVWSQPSPQLEDRTPGECDLLDNSCQKSKSQLCKSLESLATTKKTADGTKGREPCHRKTGPQPPVSSDSQAGGDRVTKRPDHRGQIIKSTFLQPMKLLEDQNSGTLHPRTLCSGEARTQRPALCEDPDFEDKSLRKPDHQTASAQELALPQDDDSWNGTLAGPEHGHLDLRRKAGTAQTPSDGRAGDRMANEPSHKEWENRRAALWRPRLPENLSSTELDETKEDQWRGRLLKTGPPG